MHPYKESLFGVVFGLKELLDRLFYGNDADNSVTMNRERLRTMITDLLWPESDNVDLNDKWFQQGGAKFHTTKPTIALLHEKLPGRFL